MKVCYLGKFQGLMAISKHINGPYILNPFRPGHYEQYKILTDGQTEILDSLCYYKPGDKHISFQTYIPWTGERERVDKQFYIIKNLHSNVIFYLLQL